MEHYSTKIRTLYMVWIFISSMVFSRFEAMSDM